MREIVAGTGGHNSNRYPTLYHVSLAYSGNPGGFRGFRKAVSVHAMRNHALVAVRSLKFERLNVQTSTTRYPTAVLLMGRVTNQGIF